MGRIAVAGAGIAGLVAARELSRLGHDVTIRESAARPGGKLRSSPVAGVPVDEGAEAMLATVPDGVRLARELGLSLLHPATTRAHLLVRGRLVPLPPGTALGVPTRLEGLPPVLGWWGTVRAGLDLFLPASHFPADPSVGRLVGARLGRRAADRLVGPILGGVYAGRPDEIAVSMAMPALVGPGRSLIRTARSRAAVPPAPPGRPVFASVPGGLAELARAVLADSGASLRLRRPVRRLERAGRTWLVDGEPFDGVVLALPAAPAGRLLEGLVPGPLLPAVPYASVAVVTLATDQPPRLAGSGLLVAPGEPQIVKAVTLLSRKWGWPDDQPFFLRASVGRAGDEHVLHRDDTELAGCAASEIAEVTGWRGRVLDARVTRWGGALPQYRPGHPYRVAELRGQLPPGLALAGAAFDGVGVPACIRSGAAAAAAVHRQVGD